MTGAGPESGSDAAEGRLAAYLERIRRAHPEIEIHSATLDDAAGQFNDLVLVNGELVFRFPKTPETEHSLEREAALLRALQGRLPLPVPNPIYTSTDPRTGLPDHVGYMLLAGEPLWCDTLAGLPIEDRRAIAAQLGEFLQALHGLGPEELNLDLPIRDTPDDWQRLYEAFRAELFPFVRADAREQVTREFGAFLGDPGSSGREPVLRHGDFGGSNILYDPGTRRVTGVLDFGSAALGDPAVDLAALTTYGPELIGHVGLAYPELLSEDRMSRARFYRGTFALQQALWALRSGDRADFEDGIHDYV